MAALDFPASPTVNQQWSAPNGAVYTWDGAVWMGGGPYAGMVAGGDLQGTYPNPTIIPAARSKWTDTGTALTPNDATKRVVVPGPTATGADQTQLTVGSRTMKGRVTALLGYDAATLTHNRYYTGSAWTQDDSTKPSWELALDASADQLAAIRGPAGGGASSSLFYVNGSDGKTYCTLANTSVTVAMLANGATIYGANAATAPANASYGTAAWTAIVSTTVAVRASGCLVLLLGTVALRGVFNNNTSTVYLGWFRDGATLITWSYDCAGSGTGLNSYLLPVMPSYDNGAAAGNHTYGLYIYNGAPSNGSVVTRPDNQGNISAWSFS